MRIECNSYIFNNMHQYAIEQIGIKYITWEKIDLYKKTFEAIHKVKIHNSGTFWNYAEFSSEHDYLMALLRFS